MRVSQRGHCPGQARLGGGPVVHPDSEVRRHRWHPQAPAHFPTPQAMPSAHAPLAGPTSSSW